MRGLFGSILVALIIGIACVIGRSNAKKKGKNQLWGFVGGAAAGSGICVFFIAILLILGPLISSAIDASNASIPTATIDLQIISTATNDPCLDWNQITPAMEGQRICVHGIAAQVYPVAGNTGNPIMRINFSQSPYTFFLLWPDITMNNGVRQYLSAGMCIQATETVKVNDAGNHQTPYMQVSELYQCAK
jgi:hypothetical protein